jgi:hypothetical protein
VTKTGPQKFPGASTAYWYQTAWGGDPMESNTIVWHSTEGTSLPSYDGGSMAPNLTALPDFKNKRLLWYQHFDFDVSSRALVHAGAVATNTLNVCQVEIVGTCDPSTHTKWAQAGYQHLYTPELPDWVVRDLAAFAKWVHDNHGVPLTSGLTFKPYPASYGTGNGVRMSNSAWTAFSGHCGHQHVPSGNVHGDPGAFPMAAILTAAQGGTTPPQEDDVALTTDDINKVAAAVYAKLLKTDDVLTAPADASDYATNKYWTWQTHIQDVTTRVRDLGKKVDGLSAVELTDSQVATLAAAVAATPALAERIAELVATKLAARLAQ